MKTFIVKNKKNQFLKVLLSKTRAWVKTEAAATKFTEAEGKKLPKKYRDLLTEIDAPEIVDAAGEAPDKNAE